MSEKRWENSELSLWTHQSILPQQSNRTGKNTHWLTRKNRTDCHWSSRHPLWAWISQKSAWTSQVKRRLHFSWATEVERVSWICLRQVLKSWKDFDKGSISWGQGPSHLQRTGSDSTPAKKVQRVSIVFGDGIQTGSSWRDKADTVGVQKEGVGKWWIMMIIILLLTMICTCNKNEGYN